MQVIRAARKLLALSPLQWSQLMRAQAAILGAAWKVRSVRIGDLVARGATIPGATTIAQSSGNISKADRLRAQDLAIAINRAANYGVVRSECLVRSIALQRLLSRDGIEGSRICVGVRREAGEFHAHAWVELDGKVIGDQAAHVRQFAKLEDVQVDAASKTVTR